MRHEGTPSKATVTPSLCVSASSLYFSIGKICEVSLHGQHSPLSSLFELKKALVLPYVRGTAPVFPPFILHFAIGWGRNDKRRLPGHRESFLRALAKLLDVDSDWEFLKVSLACSCVVRKRWLQRGYYAAVGVWLLAVVYVFWRFSVFSYGTAALSAQEVQDLKWRESWNFIIHRP